MARVRFFYTALQFHFPGMTIEYRFNAVPFFQLQSLHAVSYLAPCPHVMSDWFLWVCRIVFQEEELQRACTGDLPGIFIRET